MLLDLIGLLQIWVTDDLLLRENSDYIQAIGLSSGKFQHSLSQLRPSHRKHILLVAS